jgi:N-acetylglucosaminyl-diphospho-decaprenol L-rhamnosyltransferase
MSKAKIMIAVGIVYHRKTHPPPFEEEPGLRVMVRVNADQHGRTPWSGFAQNHNALIEQADGADWYVAVNPDVRMSATDVRRLVGGAERHGLAVAAPVLKTPWGAVGARSVQFPSPRLWAHEAVVGASRVGRTHGRAAAHQTAWVSGACMAIQLDAVERRFDERYFMYFEDVELCYRTWRAGGKVGLVNHVEVAHDSGWRRDDPLRWARGVEFARSALRFAEAAGYARSGMRLAGLLRYGSRLVMPRCSEAERVGRLSVARGFLQPEGLGLADVAHDHNVRLTSAASSRSGSL